MSERHDTLTTNIAERKAPFGNTKPLYHHLGRKTLVAGLVLGLTPMIEGNIAKGQEQAVASSTLRPGMLANPISIQKGELFNHNINTCQYFMLHDPSTQLINQTSYRFSLGKKTGRVRLKLADIQTWGEDTFDYSCSYSSDPYAQAQIVKKKKTKKGYTPLTPYGKKLRVLRPGYRGGDQSNNRQMEWHGVKLTMKRPLSARDVATRSICVRLKTTVAPRPEHTMPSQEWADKYNSGYKMSPPSKKNPLGYPDPVFSKSGTKIHCLTKKDFR